MAAKVPPKSSKTWSPDDPITLDKAIRNDDPDAVNPTHSKKVEDTHLAHPNRGQHPIKPTNSKPFNRQKKG
jgi:hypothetical protein